MLSILSLISCKTSLPLLEDEDGRDFILSTEGKLEEYACSRSIEDFFETGLEGRFTGKREVPIYYRIYRQPDGEKGTILISSGRTESLVKYKELVFDLFNNGYSVYIHDHRGQGLSGRMTGDPEMGYVDSFQFYVDDMKTFYDRYLAAGNHSRKYLLAHSMGGAIGMTYLEQFPDDFNAAAFSSPMLGLKFPICPIARLLAGKKPKYGPGQSGYQEDSTTFEGNSITGSRVRYLRMINAYEQYPEVKLGGATTLWVERSCRQFRYIFRHAGQTGTPFILLSAGNETIVDPGAHGRFINRVRQTGGEFQGYLVEEALHELFMEKDEIRGKVLTAILRFYDRY